MRTPALVRHNRATSFGETPPAEVVSRTSWKLAKLESLFARAHRKNRELSTFSRVPMKTPAERLSGKHNVAQKPIDLSFPQTNGTGPQIANQDCKKALRPSLRSRKRPNDGHLAGLLTYAS